jgi:CHAT domain-containing protein/Tfp pilus assembly protein PilF
MPRLLPALALALLSGLAAGDETGARADGLVVDEVRHASAIGQAGLRAGDVLLRWSRAAAPPASPEAASGAFVRPSDVLDVEQAEAPRAPLTLTVRRDGAPLDLVVPPGFWTVAVRPQLASADLEEYERARAQVKGPEPTAGLASWNELARAWERSGRIGDAAWLYYTLARAAVRARSWPLADAAFADARRAAHLAGDPLGAAFALTYEGRSLETRGELAKATVRHREALELYRASDRSPLLEVWGLAQMARVTYDNGDLAGSETLHHEALGIAQRLAPGSTQEAASLASLAMVAEQRGDLAAAEELDRRSLRILEGLPSVATDLPTVLNNLSGVSFARGDLAAAEEALLRSEAIVGRYNPESSNHANTLTNLGSVASARGELERAERYHLRALVIQEKLTPGGHRVAIIVRHLGDLALRAADLEAADERYRQALAMYERWTPEAFDVRLCLLNLADVSLRRGRLDEAEGYARRALDIVQKRGLSPLEGAAALHALGRVARARGDLDAAGSALEAALAIRSDVLSGSTEEAETLHELGAVAATRGRPADAIDFDLRALAALEKQRSRVGGGDEARARFGARYAPYYHDAIARLVAAGRSVEAFHVLERLRARGFLSLLAERDLGFADVPPDLDRERRRANVEYDRALSALMEAKGGDLAAERQALAEARVTQAEARTRIRAASPRLATLEDPQPLDLAATQGALDPGTLLLSYAVGDGASYVFAVGPGPGEFRVAEIPTDRRRLRDSVAGFRKLLQEESRLKRGALRAAAQDLGTLLLAPVATALVRAERLVVVPDGPLHLIPFAALADPGAAERYLVEGRPLHVVASATVFAELRKNRRDGGSGRMVAFGDPDYAAAHAGGARAAPLASAAERGLGLVPLPAARREVRELAGLFPDARVFVGDAATEEAAKASLPGGSLIHFACHGLAREDAPLDSALALTLPAEGGPGRENGLLQAWEVFEQVRLDADLVTLSACGSALGGEMSGEGVLGLTRAFQYAGARSVLSTLWTVNDESTAQLMGRFYAERKRGRSKDAALRAAQRAMLGRPATAHPYRWAAFQLSGDWR